jgi:hypothetical protein
MKTQKIFAALSLVGAIGAESIGVGAPIPASAQDPAYMSCEDLLYARNGYRFDLWQDVAVEGGAKWKRC